MLDVGAGEAPWKDLLTGAEYVGLDLASNSEFGMQRRPGIIYYSGDRLPVDDASFDHVLCVEVLEHVREPLPFLAELGRALRPGGSLALTVPWSARVHHQPWDYARFTPQGLTELLSAAGFTQVTVEERGSDLAVIANKLLVLVIRMLRSEGHDSLLWRLPAAACLAPLAAGFLTAAHLSLLLGRGSKEDPLGYAAVAVKG